MIINMSVYKPVYSAIIQSNLHNSCTDTSLLSTHRIVNRIVDN